MESEPVLVVSVGGSTPVGRCAWSSAAAVRAGISGFAQHPHMLDTAGEPMRAAFVPWLDVSAEPMERLEALLLPAIDETLEPLIELGHHSLRVALAIGLPAPRPGLPPDLEKRLKQAIRERHRDSFVGVATFATGHAAGLLALDAARKKLAEGAFDACVVAGVDSYIVPETLEWLEENDQLHGAGPLNNAWGFIPGEGAGALLLTSTHAARTWRLQPLASVGNVGLAIERNRIKTESVCIGEGLTLAFRAGFGGLPQGAQVTDVYCDMNGEPYRADEYGFACLRTKEWFASASEFIAPADCWGDVAAATGPMCIALAVIASRKGYANGPRAFVWASSESGERACAVLDMVVSGS